jgi:hypothetical protein
MGAMGTGHAATAGGTPAWMVGLGCAAAGLVSRHDRRGQTVTAHGLQEGQHAQDGMQGAADGVAVGGT